MKPGDTARLTRDVIRFRTHPVGTRVTIISVFRIPGDEQRRLCHCKDYDGTLILNIPDTALEEDQ